MDFIFRKIVEYVRVLVNFLKVLYTSRSDYFTVKQHILTRDMTSYIIEELYLCGSELIGTSEKIALPKIQEATKVVTFVCSKLLPNVIIDPLTIRYLVDHVLNLDSKSLKSETETITEYLARTIE